MGIEEIFQSWAQGPGKAEQEKCDNAVSVIKKAILSNSRLSSMDITIFAQGSYRARTNITQDSDVDVCVCLHSTFFADYPPGKNDQDFGNVAGGIDFSEYKNLVGEALVSYLGRDNVKRGNKAFDVHANTYRVDADVVAAFEHRRYTGNYNSDGTHHYHAGIEFRADRGGRIINWPEQSYSNGIEKNDATNRKYKRAIRILKRVRNHMQENGVSHADNIASFLIESLVWNVSNGHFSYDSYSEIVRNVLIHTYNATLDDKSCNEWGEVNELKYLFQGGQPWTRQQANNFLTAAWSHIGFK